MIPQLVLVTIFMLSVTEISSEGIPTANCPTTCGNLTIPFPFGLSSECSLDDSFLITCNHSHTPPKPFLDLGAIEVLDVSLDGILKVASSVAIACYDDSGVKISSSLSELRLSKFQISSTRNKLLAIGCDTYALAEWKQLKAGCVSWCDGMDRVVNGSCFGFGCCQTSIPKGTKDFLVEIRSFRNHTMVNSFSPCGYAFVVEADAFEFLSSDLKDLHGRKSVPVVLDWLVGDLTCEEARRNLSIFACRAAHSECVDSRDAPGYRCKCSTGYHGNPYIDGGCEGDGKKDVSRRQNESLTNGIPMFYLVSGMMLPAVGSSWVIWRRKQKKVVKLRRNIFVRNGGELLEVMLSVQKTLSIFTAEDLKQATNNYDENKVLHREQHLGITYKGILPGANRIVTVKLCHAFDKCKIEVLISKLIALSRTNHKNVVMLLGCCLETQVPLLVYDFITVKTLFDYLNDDTLARTLTWDVRLQIAKETAGAIAYLHFAASVPIIHGSLSSSSILLHHGYTVKVHDFAMTCSECSCRLLEKSDVYSFGFVLVELLTGKNVMSPEWLEEENLSRFFMSSTRQGNLLEILDHRVERYGNLDELTLVAEIAKRCLSSSSMERPTMKEVAIALECAKNSQL